MPMLKWEKDETVAILSMDNGKNQHNLAFAQEMNALLDDIIRDESVKSLVITSTDDKNFSQGVDLEWLMGRISARDRQAIWDFNTGMDRIFRTLLSCSIPVIGALTGHTYGNGAMLACACDFLFMRSDRGFFCFPEVNLGVPAYPGMYAMMKKAVPLYKLREMLLTGNRLTAPELEKHHIILKACTDADELKRESISFAKTFQKERKIFGTLKNGINREVLEIIDRDDPPYFKQMESDFLGK